MVFEPISPYDIIWPQGSNLTSSGGKKGNLDSIDFISFFGRFEMSENSVGYTVDIFEIFIFF